MERDKLPVPPSVVRRNATKLNSCQMKEETLYLLSNPANAELLGDGIAQLDAGKGISGDVIAVKRRL
jgi:PHD/YefM family antitoxin component YafN of YafNO toxin-antitoxin module